jgi:hypothetical protein
VSITEFVINLEIIKVFVFLLFFYLISFFAHVSFFGATRFLYSGVLDLGGACLLGLIIIVCVSLELVLEALEVGGVLVVGESHFLAEDDKEPEAFDVVGVLVIDALVDLVGALVVADAALAGGDHQAPLDFLGLQLAGPLEKMAGLFVHLLLDVVDAQPGVGLDVGGQQLVRLHVVVQGLRLVILPEEDVPDPSEHPCVVGHLVQQQLVPLQRLLGVPDHLVDARDLEHALGDGHYRLQLLQALQGFHRQVQFLVHVAQVVYRLDAVRLNPDRLQVALLGPQKFILHVEAVALVHQGLRVITIVPYRDLGIFLGVLEVVLKEV